MEEGGNLRVVRCPSCKKLLPELPDYPIYRCGGCNAALQAKKRDAGDITCENTENLHVNTSMLPDMSSNIYLDGDSPEPHPTGVVTQSSSALDYLPAVRNQFSPSSDDSVLPSGVFKSISDELFHPSGGHVVDGSLLSTFHQNLVSTVAANDVLSLDSEGQFFPYPSVMSSAVTNDPVCNCGQEAVKQLLHGSDPPEALGHGGVQLLTKLDELRDQLSILFDVSQKSKECCKTRKCQTPSSSGGLSSAIHHHGSSSASNWTTPFPLHIDNHNGLAEPGNPLAWHCHDLDMHRCFLPGNASIKRHAFLRPSSTGSTVNTVSAKNVQCFKTYPSAHLRHVQCLAAECGPVLQTQETLYDYPVCQCLNCQLHKRSPTAIPQTDFSDPNLATAINYLFRQGPHECHDCCKEDKSLSDPHQPFHVPENPILVESNIGASNISRRLHRHKVLTANRSLAVKANARVCRPVAGGAPFIVCSKCCMLLQLPNRCLFSHIKPTRFYCGTCSEVITFILDSSRISFLFPLPSKTTTSRISNDSIKLVKKDDLTSSLICEKLESVNLYDNRNVVLPNRKEDISTSYRCHQLPLSSSSFSSEEYPDCLIIQRSRSNKNREFPSSISGSPVSNDPDETSPSLVSAEFGKGNQSKRIDQDLLASTNCDLNTSQSTCSNQDPATTEMGCSLMKFPDSGFCHDSSEANDEIDHQKISKVTDSFLIGLIKKSFRDLTKPGQAFENGKFSVFVNGHPIPDRLLRKAERRAGPISPGQYWYDHRAGFWGVMGHECLGIIPPFIEELNYPMPKKCSGGNTSVFVNGRELHQKDLDLLAGRGLPIDRGKSYFIEISGRVLDEASGGELEGLGKLAPTIEKVKHGFGMRMQRAKAQV